MVYLSERSKQIHDLNKKRKILHPLFLFFTPPSHTVSLSDSLSPPKGPPPSLYTHKPIQSLSRRGAITSLCPSAREKGALYAARLGFVSLRIIHRLPPATQEAVRGEAEEAF